jgi:hypothetical protein
MIVILDGLWQRFCFQCEESGVRSEFDEEAILLGGDTAAIAMELQSSQESQFSVQIPIR